METEPVCPDQLPHLGLRLSSQFFSATRKATDEETRRNDIFPFLLLSNSWKSCCVEVVPNFFLKRSIDKTPREDLGEGDPRPSFSGTMMLTMRGAGEAVLTSSSLGFPHHSPLQPQSPLPFLILQSKRPPLPQTLTFARLRGG